MKLLEVIEKELKKLNKKSLNLTRKETYDIFRKSGEVRFPKFLDGLYELRRKELQDELNEVHTTGEQS